MSLRRKECEEIRASLPGKATNFRYSDVARWLRQAGFELHGKPKGSHRVWVHPSGTRVQLVEKGRGEMLPVYVKTAAQAILDRGECPDDEPDDAP